MKKIEIKDEPEVVELEFHIAKLLAQQNSALETRVKRTKLGYEKVQETTQQEGTPETELGDEKKKYPKTRRKKESKRMDIQSLPCRCFNKINGNGEALPHVLAEMGGTWGHLKRTLHKAVEAMNMAKYKKPSIGLLRFEPEIVDLGPVKSGDITFTEVLEPRSRGTARELVLFETVHDRIAKVKLLISRTCPLTGEEIGSLLEAIRDYDGFGPSSRGKISAVKVTPPKAD